MITVNQRHQGDGNLEYIARQGHYGLKLRVLSRIHEIPPAKAVHMLTLMHGRREASYDGALLARAA
jgi:hypothetical protein